MAKADKTPTAATAEPLTVGGFTITAGAAPAATQRIGRTGGDANPLRLAISALPAANGETFYSFFVPVTAPDGISDPDERIKATKEAQRKMTNGLTGHARRAKKADAEKNFAIRSVQEDGVYGVRVYRIAPEAVAAAPEPAAA